MTEAPKPHSKLGIAACIGGIAMFWAFLGATLYFHYAFQSETKPPTPNLNLFLIVVQMGLPVPAHLIGALLGLVAVFFPTRNKLYPVLAIGLNLFFAIISLAPWVWLALHAPGVK